MGDFNIDLLSVKDSTSVITYYYTYRVAISFQQLISYTSSQSLSHPN